MVDISVRETSPEESLEPRYIERGMNDRERGLEPDPPLPPLKAMKAGGECRGSCITVGGRITGSESSGSVTNATSSDVPSVEFAADSPC